jgi:uncharacterized protein DUF6788
MARIGTISSGLNYGSRLMCVFGDSLPKSAPVRGALVSDWKTCGKATCRCARGQRHGPYLSLRWREGGRQRRRYVRPEDAEEVRTALEVWRSLHPPAYRLRQELAALRRLLRDLED